MNHFIWKNKHNYIYLWVVYLVMDFVKLESEIRIRHNIPNYLSFDYSEKSSVTSSCPLCSNSNIFNYINPFVEANVSCDKIIDLVMSKFDLLISKDIIDNHRLHYITSFSSNNGLIQRQIEESNIINSSIHNKVDTDTVISNAISGLHARMLELSSYGDTQSKDYIETSKSLLNWVGLKKKIDGELTDSSGLDLSDVIRLKGKEEGENNANVKITQHVIRTETTTGATIERHGDKQHNRISRVNIPCEGQ